MGVDGVGLDEVRGWMVSGGVVEVDSRPNSSPDKAAGSSFVLNPQPTLASLKTPADLHLQESFTTEKLF